ncbi:NUDIX hydrolase [Jannaschia sp. EhC01]|nr:NUDIX hydrolase [Jannaschia sp. EhC01]
MADASPPSAQRPLRIRADSKRDPRTQFAGLPFRVLKGKAGKRVEVLLVTSRETQRWIIPKGWPMDGMTPAEAAAQEVWEEAGARGKGYDVCLGLYSYRKWMSEDESLPVIVAVFPVKVRTLEDDYPEVGERKRKWFSLKKAAAKVEERDLRQLIATFSVDRLT